MKKAVIGVVVLLCLGSTILWPLKIQPYLKMKQHRSAMTKEAAFLAMAKTAVKKEGGVQTEKEAAFFAAAEAEIKKEEEIQTEKFRQEYERMSNLAATAHEDCFTKLILNARMPAYRRVGLPKIPAYPHLSDIYVYVVPPMAREYEKIYSEEYKETLGESFIFANKYSPLTVEKIEEFRNYTKQYHNSEWTPQQSAAELLQSVQKEVLTPVILEGVQESLGPCTAEAGGTPKKIKLVDTPFHDNLEQEDALTIVVGALYYEKAGPVPTIPIRTYTLSLHAAEYIPRWRIFPEQYRGDSTTIYGFRHLKDDPYAFAPVDVRANDIFPLERPNFRKNLWVQYETVKRIFER